MTSLTGVSSTRKPQTGLKGLRLMYMRGGFGKLEMEGRGREGLFKGKQVPRCV